MYRQDLVKTLTILYTYSAGGLTIDPTVGFRKRGYVGQFYAK